MSKRSFPFDENTFGRQVKTRVTERINSSSEEKMQEVYGARRAAEQPSMAGAPGSSHKDSFDELGDDSEMEWDPEMIPPFRWSVDMGCLALSCAKRVPIYNNTRRSMSRIENIKRSEKRDPSPIPSKQNRLTSYINMSRRTHEVLIENETETVANQNKTYRQLNLDLFMKNEDLSQEDLNQNFPLKKDEKDNSNGMEF